MSSRTILAALSAFAVLLAFGVPAEATESADAPLEQIANSDHPLETLDAMSREQKLRVQSWINEASESEVKAVFARNSPYPVQSGRTFADPMARDSGTGYSDIIFSWTERAACVIWVDLISCQRAAKDANAASSEAKKLFPASLHNGRGDAFRHCYWNARMVHSIGYRGAVKIATNHEALGRGPAAEVRMDMANNKAGWSVGKSTSTNAKASQACSLKATLGKLVTL